jgi:hypothetical protein
MAEGLGDHLLRLFGRKKERLSGSMKILGKYNMGNILAFTDEFPDLADEMMRRGSDLRAGKAVKEIAYGRDQSNKHHLVPVVTIFQDQGRYYLRYIQEWRNERDEPDNSLTISGNMMEIKKGRAREILKRFSEFDESSKYPW